MRKLTFTLILLAGIAIGAGASIAVTASLPMPPENLLFTRLRFAAFRKQ